jgi:hypothetical protein
MDAREIVADLRRRGMQLWTEGDDVLIDPDELTEADAATIMTHKPAILALLHAESASGATTAPRGQFTWTPHDVEVLLTAVFDRCGFWREQAARAARPRIEALMKEVEPVIAERLEAKDYDAVLEALLCLQRRIGDLINGAN